MSLFVIGFTSALAILGASYFALHLNRNMQYGLALGTLVGAFSYSTLHVGAWYALLLILVITNIVTMSMTYSENKDKAKEKNRARKLN